MRTTELTRWLSQQPGRCPACGFHLRTQGHREHCPRGFRARFALGRDGRMYGTARKGPEL